MRSLTPCSRWRRSRSNGFTLIEVLVSLVILSIGLLGTAKLMMFSSRANDSAYLRSQATALAYAILDDMRANKLGAVAGGYTTTTAAAAAAPGFVCHGGASCTPGQLALYDVYQWKLRLDAASGGAMPSGQGAVTTTPAGAQTTVLITVSWDDSVAQASLGAPAGSNTQSITLESLL
jgi:type IV pilus assembly protein PilV